MRDKSLVFTTDFSSNYITHIYTLSNAGFIDIDYEKKYGNSICKKDIDFLKQQKSLLQFSQGVNGLYSAIFYFVAAFNFLQTQNQWRDYFLAWNNYVINHNSEVIKPYFKNYHFPKLYEQYSQIDKLEWKNTVVSIFNIFIKNLNNYKIEIFPEVESVLIKRCSDLNNKLEDINYISKWQKITGYKYLYKTYYVYLYYAGKNGPSWNDICLNKNTAYFNHKTKYMLDMISHEVGVHILISDLWQVINKLKNKGHSHSAVYYAFEMLATYYNSCVLNRLGNDVYNEKCQQLIDFYNTINRNKKYTPKELLVKAVNYLSV